MGTPKAHLQLSPRQFGPKDVEAAGNDAFPEQWLAGRKMTLKKIPLEHVDTGNMNVLDDRDGYPDTWTRGDIGDMHRMSKKVDNLPPIVVGAKNDEGKYPLWDGTHRTYAHAKAGRKRIKAFVMDPKS
jgi:hypothetical protein